MGTDPDCGGIIVAKLDRLTRSAKDLAKLFEDFFTEKAGKHLFSVNEMIETRTANGRFQISLMTLIAQWELETIVERTLDGMDAKPRLGQRVGQTPYGFDLDEDGPRNKRGIPMDLKKNADEQKTLANIRELHKAGVSDRAIARALNAQGILAKKGKEWKHSTIHRLVARP